MGGVFRLELDRNFTKFVVIGLLIFYLFGLAIVQVGIMKYNSQVKKNGEFMELEQKKVQRYINVQQFGWAGIRRALESTQLSAMFFNSSPLDSLVSFCDVGFRLELSKTEIGNGLFEDTHKGRLDYSWYILTIGGLFVLVWGFFAFRNKEYIRLILDFTTLKNARFGILLARIFLIFICQLIFLFLYWIQFLINGIALTPRDLLSLLVFLLISTLVLAFLLVLSSAFGSVKNVIVGGIVTGVVFFILIWLWPEILNVVFLRLADADIKSFYAHEIKKVDKLMNFENVTYEKIGTGRYSKQQIIDIENKAGEEWYNNEFVYLENQEKGMLDKTDKLIKKFHFVSIINPATFYNAVNGELSSKGFNAYKFFYSSILDGQKKFLRYYLDNRLRENYLPKIEHILKDDELVLKSKSSLPYYFVLGIILIILYIIGALIYSFASSKKFIFPAIRGKTSNLDIALKTGEDVHIMTDEQCNDLIFNILNGEIEIDGNITIDGISILTNDIEDYYYSPDVKELPGNLTVRSIASLAKVSSDIEIKGKRLKDIDFESQLRLMLKIAKSCKRKIYVFNLSVPSAYYEFLRDIKDEFKFFKNGAAVIYLCPENSNSPVCLDPEGSWLFMNFKGEYNYEKYDSLL